MAQPAQAPPPQTRPDDVEAELDQGHLPAPANGGESRKIRGGEFMRKALHMTPGLFPFGLAFVSHPDPLQWNEIWFIAQICIVFTLGFLALHRVVRRPGENNLLSTTLSYPITIMVMLALFPAHSEFTCVVVAILAFGDGAAYFGGTLFGKRKLPWNPRKSWAGMISFVVFSAPIAAFAYWLEGRTPDGSLFHPPVALAVACALVASIAGAIAETIDTPITDNLRVGVASSLGVVAAYYAFSGVLL